MTKFAYLTLFTKNSKGEYKYLIGQKKFLNLNDGYIGTNPNQYVIPGGNIMLDENPQTCAVREFEEETGFNLFDLGCDNLIEIYSNKYAKFYLAEIPYQNKNDFKYNKELIKNNGHYPEFIKFKWVNKSEAIKYFKRRPKIDKLLEIFYQNLDKFIDYQPNYLNSDDYIVLKNNKDDPIINNTLKRYIKKRLDNGWFTDMFNKI